MLTIGQLADRARHADVDVVCVTDHNVISAAVEASEAAARGDLDVRIIVGQEIRTSAGEVIGLFLTERIPYVLRRGMPVVTLGRPCGRGLRLQHLSE